MKSSDAEQLAALWTQGQPIVFAFVRSSTNGWLLYDVAGATTNFANLSITPENWLDGNTLAFDTARPGSSFSLVQDGSDIYLNYTFNQVSAVPEPSTYGLALLGLAWFGLVGWRRRGSIANC